MIALKLWYVNGCVFTLNSLYCLYMSPLGIQRLVAFIIFFSPWVFIPNAFKDIVFIIAGIFLFVSTLDLRKRQRHTHPHLEENQSNNDTNNQSISL